MWFRNLIDIALLSPRQRLTDYREEIDSILSALKEQQHVVINLGPFPCADRAIDRTRRYVAAVMKEVCAKREVIYIDPYSVLYSGEDEISHSRFHFDSIHISKYSHKKLGEALANAILSAHTPPNSDPLLDANAKQRHPHALGAGSEGAS
jgi:hypothetical protein